MLCRVHHLLSEKREFSVEHKEQNSIVPILEPVKQQPNALNLAIDEMLTYGLKFAIILNPKDGKPVVTPSQDMVLGNYYLTIERIDEVNEGHFYRDYDEAYLAYKNKLTVF